MRSDTTWSEAAAEAVGRVARLDSFRTGHRPMPDVMAKGGSYGSKVAGAVVTDEGAESQ